MKDFVIQIIDVFHVMTKRCHHASKTCKVEYQKINTCLYVSLANFEIHVMICNQELLMLCSRQATLKLMIERYFFFIIFLVDNLFIIFIDENIDKKIGKKIDSDLV